MHTMSGPRHIARKKAETIETPYDAADHDVVVIISDYPQKPIFVKEAVLRRWNDSFGNKWLFLLGRRFEVMVYDMSEVIFYAQYTRDVIKETK